MESRHLRGAPDQVFCKLGKLLTCVPTTGCMFLHAMYEISARFATVSSPYYVRIAALLHVQ